MCNIKVTIKDGRASIYTPFNRDFVAAIRNVGGRKWDGENKCWTVPEEALPEVRKIMTDRIIPRMFEKLFRSRRMRPMLEINSPAQKVMRIGMDRITKVRAE